MKEAQAGVLLEHLPTPPAAVAPRAGSQYFLVRQAGPCWDAIVKSGEVGIYVPEAMAEAAWPLRGVLPCGVRR